jgi:hypothetical protein
MRPHPFALSALLLAAAGTASAQEAVLLRIRGTIGQPVHGHMVMATYMRGGPFEAMGADTSVPTMRLVTFMTQTLDSVKGDTLLFQAVIDSAHAESPLMPQLSMMMESAMATTPKRSTIRMDSRGRILALALGVSGDAGAAASLSFGGTGGAFGSNGAPYTLPEQPVRVGDTWTATTNMTGLPSGATANGSLAYRLERIEPVGSAGTAVISMSGTTSMTFAGTQAEMPMAAILRFDIAAGRVTAMATTMAYAASSPMGDMTGRVELTQAEAGESAPPLPPLPAAAPLPRPASPPAAPPPGGGKNR